MVICLGWPSPATSSSLPAACAVGVGHTTPPIWPCSDWGLPCRRCYQWRGGLLPHRFTLTSPALASHAHCSRTLRARGGLFSVALSVAFRRPGVTWQSTRWSSDFPRDALRHPRPSRPTRRAPNVTGAKRYRKRPPAQPVSPSRARPCSACRTNGRRASSADRHWVSTSWYSWRASARRPSCS